MFEQPMQVGAEAIDVSVTPEVAVVTFRQTWASGSYRDVGPKQLVVAATADGPRIAREEMLSSEIVTPPGTQALDAKPFLLTAEGMVLDADPSEEWASGAARPGARESVALRSVEESRLPPALRAWKGRAVRTVSDHGSSCETTVSGFTLRAEVVPHFGSVQSWHGQLDTPALTPTQIAQEIWTLAQGGTVLLAQFTKPCEGLWALESSRPTPVAKAPEAAPPALEAAALKALRALPDYAKIQTDFASYPNSQGPWHEYGEHALRAFVFRNEGEIRLVSIFASAGTGCGDFEGNLGALFSVQPGSARRLVFVTTIPRQDPTSSFDLDGDASLEILFGSAKESDSAWLFRQTPAGPSVTELFGVPFLDCGC